MAIDPVSAGIGILSLITQLFKKNPKQTTEVTSTPGGYQSPTLGLMDPLIGMLLTENQMRYSGAGFPGGAGLDTSNSMQLLNFLKGEYPRLLALTKGGLKGQPKKNSTTSFVDSTGQAYGK